MGEIELLKAKGEYEKMEAEYLDGELYFTGCLVIHDKLLYVNLDADDGNFTCFADKTDYDQSGKPLIYLKIIDIWDVKHSIGLEFGSKDAECFTIFCKDGNFKFYSFEKDKIEE